MKIFFFLKIAFVTCVLMLGIQTFTYSQGEITPVSERTSHVRDAIVAAVPDVDSADSVTAEHLAAITTLYLSREGISSLFSGDFDGLTALETLDLAFNDLMWLPSDIFDGLTALKTLNLAFNDLVEWREGTLDELIALETLVLNANDLTSLPENIVEHNTALEEFYFSFSDLTTLPESIFENNTELEKVGFNSSTLTALPESIFENNTELKEVYFGSCDELTFLPANIFEHNTTLEKVDFAFSGVTSLPDNIFGNNTSLIEIDFSFNELTSLPTGIFVGLTALETVYLFGNNSSGPFKFFPLTVSLEEIENEEGQFKVTIPSGTPVELTVPLSVSNGTIGDSVTSVTISIGGSESEALTVTRTHGITAAVTVNIGTLPSLPGGIWGGYYFSKSDSLPLEIFPAIPRSPASANTMNTPPNSTQLLANYPNPFNPETWIPYHLANPANVVITIYDTRGSVIRRLELGHQREGYYTSRSRAVYWDGRNSVGEPVASGVYFYQLRADNMSLLRKMLIVK